MKYKEENIDQKFDNGDIDLEKLEELMKNAYQQVEKARGKNLVLVIGHTGAGKSTTVNYLTGVKLSEKAVNGKFVITTEDEDKSCAQIGHTASSQTLYPEIFFDKDNKIAYCDCPGFEDNRGKEERICITISMELLVKLSNNIQSVIVVIDHAELSATKGKEFKNLITILGELFKKPEKLKSSIIFVMTKVKDKRITEKNILEEISGLLENAKQHEESRKFKNSTFPLSSSTKKPKHKKIQARENTIKMLDLMEISNENIIIIDPLDKSAKKGEHSKIKILKLLENKKILKDSFNFKHNDLRNEFKKLLCNISAKATLFLKKKIELPSDIQDHEEELRGIVEKINSFLIQIVNLKNHEQSTQHQKIQLELDIQKHKKIIKDNEDLIREQKIKLESTEKGIKDIKEKIKALNSDEEIIHHVDFVNDKRNRFGIFAWTKKVFNYNGIPFVRVEEIYDNKTGIFRDVEKDEKGGKYTATYESGYYQNGKATIHIIAKKNETEEIKQDIKRQDNDLKEKEKLRTALEKKIDKLNQEKAENYKILIDLEQTGMKTQEAIKQRTEFIKKEITISLKNVEKLEKKIKLKKNELSEAEKILKINEASFEMVANISKIIDLESPLIFEFLDQFNKLKNKKDVLNNITLNTTSVVTNLVEGFIQMLETEKAIMANKTLNLASEGNNIALDKDVSKENIETDSVQLIPSTEKLEGALSVKMEDMPIAGTTDNSLSAFQFGEKNHNSDNKKLPIRMLANEPDSQNKLITMTPQFLLYKNSSEQNASIKEHGPFENNPENEAALEHLRHEWNEKTEDKKKNGGASLGIL